MKSRFTLFLSAASALAVVGCGTAPVAGIKAQADSQLSAKASQTLRQGFDDVHKAIFDAVDRNKDGNIDEYEAGPYFNLRTEFPKADRTKAGVINYNEFMAYATKGGFLSSS
ncbi:MAG: EF-hand domain-containing protein, partial [Candidatus Sericytochromatia bacterium]|nr:EF-hand domain-containing protein [Candidatus Tanganyikabacteria bacterium]